MASEHILQLKAVLDTTDVKQKLDQLKSSTQSSAQGASSGSTTNLAAMLRNLNTTLMNLQRSIDKLVLNSKQTSTAVKQNNTTLPISARPFGLSGSTKTGGIRTTPQYQKFNKQLNDMLFSKNSIFTPLEQKVMKLRYAGGTRNFAHNMLMNDAFADLGYSRKDYIAAQKRYVANHVGKPQLTTPVPSRQTRAQRYVNRQLVTLGAGVVLGGISDYARESGDKGLAKATSWGSNIAMGAGTGAMLGGPAGAAIGAAAGLLQSAFEELASSARDAAEALDKQDQRFFKAQAIDNKVTDFNLAMKDKEELKKAEKSGDWSYFQAEAKHQREWAANLEQSFIEGEIGFGGKGKERFHLREYERQTKKLMEQRDHEDPEVKRRQGVATLYAANIEHWMNHINRAEAMQDIVDKLKDRQPKALTREQQLDSILSNQHATLTERLAAMKAPDMGNVNSLASQGFMISKSDDEARLNMQNDYLRDIANITREIKNIEQQKGEGASYL